MKGKFITFEGPDGAGKTVQMKAFIAALTERGYDVVQSREPGGTPIGEKIRELLLHDRMGIKAEMLLFAAARSEHVELVIKPALNRGAIVVCDRFSDSSFAYQGTGRDAEYDVEELERFVLRGFQPDYTLFFDVTLQASMERIAARYNQKCDIFDAATKDFKLAVYRGFKKRFLLNPHRMVRIDAMKTMGEVEEQLRAWTESVLIPQIELEKTASELIQITR